MVSQFFRFMMNHLTEKSNSITFFRFMIVMYHSTKKSELINNFAKNSASQLINGPI